MFRVTSGTRVVASVCANFCSAGWWEARLLEIKIDLPIGFTINNIISLWWEALLVERGEHCERCNRCTGRYQRWCDGLEAPEDWLAVHNCWWLRAAVCVVVTAFVFLPTNMTWSRLKKLPSAGQGSSGAKLMSGGKSLIQAAVRKAQYKQEPQHGADKEADMERAGSKTQCKKIYVENWECGALLVPYFFSTNMTRSRNKLQSTGQGPSGANQTSGGKLPNLAAGPRELASGNNGCANW